MGTVGVAGRVPTERLSFPVFLLSMIVVVSLPETLLGQDSTRQHELREMRREKAENLEQYEPPGVFENFLGSVQDMTGSIESDGGGFYGFKPHFGGLKRGSGLVAGLRFVPLGESSPLLLSADASISHKKYWGVGANVGYRWEAASVRGYGQYRHMPSETFYGFGTDSAVEAVSNYRLDETVGGGLVSFSMGSGFSVGARSSFIRSVPGRGLDEDVPDATVEFAGEVPTLHAEARHVGVGAWVEYDGRNPAPSSSYFRYVSPTEPDVVEFPIGTDRGVYALAEAVRYHGLDGTPSFTRVHVQSQQFIPFRRGRNVFAFREYLGVSNRTEGDEVPLYMQPTLGGPYTIRGYDAFRFRDRHAFLVNAEYRWHIWLFTDLALFVDAGQVFDSFDELSVGSLHGAYGAGLRFIFGDRGLGRVDVGRSEEGTKVYIRLGATI